MSCYLMSINKKIGNIKFNRLLDLDKVTDVDKLICVKKHNNS